MTAGVFDSGVGGLTVVKSLLEHGLFERIIYYGDTARVPYGVKDKNTIIRYSLEALEFFKNFKIDILIIACNTVSAHAIPELKANAPFDVVGVIEPGVMALENKIPTGEENILIIGTKATISSGQYQRLLSERGYANIHALPTGLFVPIVEEGIFDGPVLEAAMEHYFHGLKRPDAVILGCTHFPLIAKPIARYFGQTHLIHSGEAIVEHLQKSHNCHAAFGQTRLELFASENPGGLKAVAKKWLGDLYEESEW